MFLIMNKKDWVYTSDESNVKVKRKGQQHQHYISTKVTKVVASELDKELITRQRQPQHYLKIKVAPSELDTE